MLGYKRLGLFKRNFLAFDGVDEVLFELFHLLFRGALHRIHAGALNERALLLREKLNALGGAVCTLVVLTREVGDGEHRIAFAELHRFPVNVVYGRF